MRLVRLLKPALFIYECFRLVILALTLVYLLPNTSAIPWMVIASPGTLFPLMALFIWLDTKKYNAFLNLFFAGKCIGIIAMLGWSIIYRQVTMTTGYSSVYFIAELFLLFGDLTALACAFLITKNFKKSTITEVAQCG